MSAINFSAVTYPIKPREFPNAKLKGIAKDCAPSAKQPSVIDSPADLECMKSIIGFEDAALNPLFERFVKSRMDITQVNATSGPQKAKINSVWKWDKNPKAILRNNRVYIKGTPNDANGATILINVKQGQKLTIVNKNNGGSMWYGPTGYEVETSGSKYGENFWQTGSDRYTFTAGKDLSLIKVKVSPDYRGYFEFEIE